MASTVSRIARLILLVGAGVAAMTAHAQTAPAETAPQPPVRAEADRMAAAIGRVMKLA